MINYKTIVTMPPYAPFMEEVLKHPVVEGIRLNTVMPVSESLDDLIKRMKDTSGKYGKKLWVDLKARQLRIKSYGVPPFTEIELTHDISVKTPVKAYFSNGEDTATILQVKNGNKLIMQEGPARVVGPGEAINILDPTLNIEGFLTDLDKEYVESCIKNDNHYYMLSFVEDLDDVRQLYNLDNKAQIIAKIESKEGLDYINNRYDHRKHGLMAARGDLYIEVSKPHKIIKACEDIISKDKHAIAASRIFSSLSKSLEPSCEDIGDMYGLLSMGYHRFMFGDDICLHRDSIISGLNLFEAMTEEYKNDK